MQIGENKSIKSKDGSMAMFTDRRYVFCSTFQKSVFLR
jgi:hypothetical protein